MNFSGVKGEHISPHPVTVDGIIQDGCLCQQRHSRWLPSMTFKMAAIDDVIQDGSHSLVGHVLGHVIGHVIGHLIGHVIGHLIGHVIGHVIYDVRGQRSKVTIGPIKSHINK